MEGRGVTKLLTTCLAVLALCLAESALASCVTLTWTAPGDDGFTGVARYYDLRYSTSPITANNWDQATRVKDIARPRVAGANEACLVAGLAPNTLYYFGLRTADERQNWSGISNIALVTSPDDHCHGHLGNVNCDPDGVIDIADISSIIDHLFLSLRPLCCPDAANVSGDPGGEVDISDVSAMVYYLFISASETPSCPVR